MRGGGYPSSKTLHIYPKLPNRQYKRTKKTIQECTAHCAEILRNLIPKHHISCHLVPWERSASGTTTCIGCSCGAHKDVLLDLFQSCLGGAPQCQCQAGKGWFLCTIVVFKSWPKHCPRRRLDVFPNQTNSRPVFVCQVLNSAPVQCFRLKWITFWHVL